MKPKFKPACYFSPIESIEDRLTEKTVLNIIKSSYPIYLTRDHLQYILNYSDTVKFYDIIISLGKKGLINKITIFHCVNGKSISLNGYQFNLNSKGVVKENASNKTK